MGGTPNHESARFVDAPRGPSARAPRGAAANVAGVRSGRFLGSAKNAKTSDAPWRATRAIRGLIGHRRAAYDRQVPALSQTRAYVALVVIARSGQLSRHRQARARRLPAILPRRRALHRRVRPPRASAGSRGRGRDARAGRPRASGPPRPGRRRHLGLHPVLVRRDLLHDRGQRGHLQAATPVMVALGARFLSRRAASSRSSGSASPSRCSRAPRRHERPARRAPARGASAPATSSCSPRSSAGPRTRSMASTSSVRSRLPSRRRGRTWAGRS